MGKLQDLIAWHRAEEGYIEKESNSDLDSKTGNRGDNNYTKYSRDVNNAGLMGCQGQPWCATYQMASEIAIFGVEEALRHWNMSKSTYVGYNCFSTYNAFKAAGKVGMTPKLGALVVFNFSHMGRVINIYSRNGVQYYECAEGNTSSNLNDRNGGMVKIKERRFDDLSTVKGFCYIDYEQEKPASYSTGWHQDEKGWWYAYGTTKRSYYKSCWQKINGHWYYFDSEGYILTDWHEIDGRWYYFQPDGNLQGALWHEAPDRIGAMEIWEV